MTDDDLMSLSEISKQLNCSRKAVRKWIQSGQLPGTRDAKGHWRISLEAARRCRDSQDISHRPLSTDYGIDGAEATEDMSTLKREQIRAQIRAKEIDAERKEWELERKKREHEMVELSEVEAFISAWLAESRNILKTVPVKCRRFGLDVQNAVEQEIDLALHAIRKKSEQLVELRD